MVKPARSITEIRMKIHKELDSPGITPITRNGEMAGILISVDKESADKLSKRLEFNPKAAINELL